jgi:hypothetical protein
VDGFSLGAVAGFSEQHSVISLGNENDVAAFLKVGAAPARLQRPPSSSAALAAAAGAATPCVPTY